MRGDFDEDEDDYESCPRCHGDGWIEYRVDDIERDEVICPLCRGLGEWPPARATTDPRRETE